MAVTGRKDFMESRMRRKSHVRFGERDEGTRTLQSVKVHLVPTLHLVFAATLVFYEIVFNLSTMMQAAGRSLRLNQTQAHCKTYYLYHTDTMEETAVYLMSRKQRAAKLLNGDIGLTGLDALTEGEAGLEEALLTAIGKEESLVNPGELFKASATPSEIDAEDAAYWNVEAPNVSEPEVPLTEPVLPRILLAEPQINGAEATLAFQPAAAKPIMQAEAKDALLVLQATQERLPITNDPFARGTAPAKGKPARPAVKRRKPSLLDVPLDLPPTRPTLPPTPPLPLFTPQRVAAGLQIPLF